jgi:uncharacterized membrane protein YgcG
MAYLFAVAAAMVPVFFRSVMRKRAVQCAAAVTICTTAILVWVWAHQGKTSLVFMALSFALYHGGSEFTVVLAKAELGRLLGGHSNKVQCEDTSTGGNGSTVRSRCRSHSANSSGCSIGSGSGSSVRSSSSGGGSSGGGKRSRRGSSSSSSGGADVGGVGPHPAVGPDVGMARPKARACSFTVSSKDTMMAVFFTVFLASWGIQFALTKALPSSRFLTYQKFLYYGAFLGVALGICVVFKASRDLCDGGSRSRSSSRGFVTRSPWKFARAGGTRVETPPASSQLTDPLVGDADFERSDSDSGV